MKSDTNVAVAKDLLREALVLYGADIGHSYQWVRESSRWNELAFAMMVQVIDAPEGQVRTLIENLDAMGYLEVGRLAGLCDEQGNCHLDSAEAQRILKFVTKNAIDADEAARALTTVSEAAWCINKEYAGKIQLFLREVGLSAIDRLCALDKRGGPTRFSLTAEQCHLALTYWLQNVLDMPLSLSDAEVQDYCRSHQLTPEDLIVAADEMDINVAIVDDLAQIAAAREREEASPLQDLMAG